jgi:hypothetical protein
MSVQGHRSFLGRFIVISSAASAIELGYFFASSKIFLWKSPRRAEENLRMRATRKRKATDVFRAEVDFEQVLYRLALHAQSRQQHCLHRARRVRRARSRMWLKGARSLSNVALTSGRQPSAPGAENVLSGTPLDKNKGNRLKSLIFSARGEATGLTLRKNCPLSRTF